VVHAAAPARCRAICRRSESERSQKSGRSLHDDLLRRGEDAHEVPIARAHGTPEPPIYPNSPHLCCPKQLEAPVAPTGGAITQIIDDTGDGAGNNLGFPDAIVVDSSGNVYVVGEFFNNAFKITPGPNVLRHRADFGAAGVPSAVPSASMCRSSPPLSGVLGVSH
jgi:hypothetical protein